MQPSDFFEVFYDDKWNAIGLRKVFPEPGEEPSPQLDTIVQLRPRFEMGASTEDPSLGGGGALVEYTREEYTNGIRISMDIYIHSSGVILRRHLC